MTKLWTRLTAWLYRLWHREALVGSALDDLQALVSDYDALSQNHDRLVHYRARLEGQHEAVVAAHAELLSTHAELHETHSLTQQKADTLDERVALLQSLLHEQTHRISCPSCNTSFADAQCGLDIDTPTSATIACPVCGKPFNVRSTGATSAASSHVTVSLR